MIIVFLMAPLNSAGAKTPGTAASARRRAARNGMLHAGRRRGPGTTAGVIGLVGAVRDTRGMRQWLHYGRGGIGERSVRSNRSVSSSKIASISRDVSTNDDEWRHDPDDGASALSPIDGEKAPTAPVGSRGVQPGGASERGGVHTSVALNRGELARSTESLRATTAPSARGAVDGGVAA